MAGGVGGAGAGRGRSVSPGEPKGPAFGHLILAGLFASNFVLIVAWPWLGPTIRDALDPFYSSLCHRMPQRCYVLVGEPMPACARCVGVWLGLAIMATIGALARVWRLRTGLMLFATMALSWTLGGVVLPETWHFERTLTGIGGGLGVYVIAVRIGRWLARVGRGRLARSRAGQ